MARALLSRWHRKPAFSAVAPKEPFYAIGDIHGCAALLAQALELAKGHPIVCVGDYVDRGPQSAQVLRMLHDRPDITCLSGNHEEMMLGFIDAPETHGSRWLRYGGRDTLASFGVNGADHASDDATLRRARDQLVDAMGQPLIAWMQAFPSVWQSGNVAVVHAAADPDVAIPQQTSDVLRWGHAAFRKQPRNDGIWVIHGHTIVDAPQIKDGHISIDTGAYATGRLTVAHVGTDAVTFETIS